MGDGSRIHARDADLAATATDAATAIVTSSAIGLVSKGDVAATATDTSTVDAHRSDHRQRSTAGRDGTVTLTGALGVKATLTSPVRATTDALVHLAGVSDE